MRILLIADLHIGSIKDINYMYNVTTDIIEKEIMFTKTDMVVILGDYFHRLFKVNEDYVALAINIMTYLVRACIKCKTKVRIVYGTESHEMNQYVLFNYHMISGDIDFKVFDTVTEEEINGRKILYVPEEYINDKHDHYKKYLYSNKNYDYIFGHGVIEDQMPSAVSFTQTKTNEKKVPHFKSGELQNVSKITVFGHYHVYDYSNIGEVYYLGSLFRDSFGEEAPKGYGIIEDDKFTFVENTEAYIYKTYEYDEESDIYDNQDNIIREIKRIKDENTDVFNGTKVGRIRLLFKTPEGVDPTFKENIKSMLFNDKYTTLVIREKISDLSLEVKDDIDNEYDFLIDNSLSIVDKIHQFMTKQYDDPMSMEMLQKYLGNPFR